MHFVGILAGGTNKGHIAFWKYNPSRPDEPWDLQSPSEVDGCVQCIKVCYSLFWYNYKLVDFDIIPEFRMSIKRNIRNTN